MLCLCLPVASVALRLAPLCWRVATTVTLGSGLPWFVNKGFPLKEVPPVCREWPVMLCATVFCPLQHRHCVRAETLLLGLHWAGPPQKKSRVPNSDSITTPQQGRVVFDGRLGLMEREKGSGH